MKTVRLLVIALIVAAFALTTQGRTANAAASFTFTSVVTSATCSNESFSAFLEFNTGLGTAFNISYTDTVSTSLGNFSSSGVYGSFVAGLYYSLVSDSATSLGIASLAYPYTVSETLTATDGTSTYWTTLTMTCNGGSFGNIVVTSGSSTSGSSGNVAPAYIPAGFVQRTITCTVAMYSEPTLDRPVAGTKIIGGQRWYINPKPVTGKDGKSWTVIYPGNNTGVNAYIPTSCVAAG